MDFKSVVAEEMFYASAPELQILAQNALVDWEISREDLILYCLEADCLLDVVSVLQPEQNWQKMPSAHFIALAIGATTWDKLRPLSDRLPDILKIRQLPLSVGCVRALIVHSQGWVALELPITKISSLH